MDIVDRMNMIMARRNMFHLDDAMNIQYCPYDDRKNCRHLFHADTVDNVKNLILSSDFDKKADFMEKDSRDSERDMIRSRQISANIRGDRAEDIRLFNMWFSKD